MSDAAGAPAAGRREDSAFWAWATGGAVLAACADLLVAVIAGLEEPRPGGGLSVLSLSLPLEGAALLSMALAALSWTGRPAALAGAGLVHAAIAVGGGLWIREGLGGMPKPILAVLVVHGLCAVLAFSAAGGLRSAAPESVGRRMTGAAGATAENLESVLVAIVFALVIRHFAVEAYKIPTSSMEPTLLGDKPNRGTGDRVLVKKWEALFGAPDRWEIWVFRPPLDRTINYVKRCVGLPGETVEIREGDLYVDGKVARKPPKTREDMWFPVWPRVDGRTTAKSSPPWDAEGFRKDGEDGFSIAGATERRLARYNRKIGDGLAGDSDRTEVGDVRLRFEVADAAPGTELVVRLVGRAGPCEVRIAADGSKVAIDAAGVKHDGATLPGGPVRNLEVSFADLQFEVRVNGGAWTKSLEVPDPPGRGTAERRGVSFGVEKGGATFRAVRLDRDVHYTSEGTTRFVVPGGRYLFLGDNSSNSQDARRWQAWEITETGGAGRTFYAEHRPSMSRTDGRLEFRDRNGVRRSYAPAEVAISDGTVPMSFVPTEDLHGRAFSIFWPPRWFTSMEGGRLRTLP